jgi:hypothetical protein
MSPKRELREKIRAIVSEALEEEELQGLKIPNEVIENWEKNSGYFAAEDYSKEDAEISDLLFVLKEEAKSHLRTFRILSKHSTRLRSSLVSKSHKKPASKTFTLKTFKRDCYIMDFFLKWQCNNTYCINWEKVIVTWNKSQNGVASLGALQKRYERARKDKRAEVAVMLVHVFNKLSGIIEGMDECKTNANECYQYAPGLAQDFKRIYETFKKLYIENDSIFEELQQTAGGEHNAMVLIAASGLHSS